MIINQNELYLPIRYQIGHSYCAVDHKWEFTSNLSWTNSPFTTDYICSLDYVVLVLKAGECHKYVHEFLAIDRPWGTMRP